MNKLDPTKLEWRVEPGIGSSEYLTLGLLDIEVREMWATHKSVKAWVFRIWGTKDHQSGTYGVISEKSGFSKPEEAKVAAIAMAREFLSKDLMLLRYAVNG